MEEVPSPALGPLQIEGLWLRMARCLILLLYQTLVFFSNLSRTHVRIPLAKRSGFAGLGAGRLPARADAWETPLEDSTTSV